MASNLFSPTVGDYQHFLNNRQNQNSYSGPLNTNLGHHSNGFGYQQQHQQQTFGRHHHQQQHTNSGHHHQDDTGHSNDVLTSNPQPSSGHQLYTSTHNQLRHSGHNFNAFAHQNVLELRHQNPQTSQNVTVDASLNHTRPVVDVYAPLNATAQNINASTNQNITRQQSNPCSSRDITENVSEINLNQNTQAPQNVIDNFTVDEPLNHTRPIVDVYAPLNATAQNINASTYQNVTRRQSNQYSSRDITENISVININDYAPQNDKGPHLNPFAPQNVTDQNLIPFAPQNVTGQNLNPFAPKNVSGQNINPFAHQNVTVTDQNLIPFAPQNVTDQNLIPYTPQTVIDQHRHFDHQRQNIVEQPHFPPPFIHQQTIHYPQISHPFIQHEILGNPQHRPHPQQTSHDYNHHALNNPNVASNLLHHTPGPHSNGSSHYNNVHTSSSYPMRSPDQPKIYPDPRIDVYNPSHLFPPPIHPFYPPPPPPNIAWPSHPFSNSSSIHQNASNSSNITSLQQNQETTPGISTTNSDIQLEEQEQEQEHTEQQQFVTFHSRLVTRSFSDNIRVLEYGRCRGGYILRTSPIFPPSSKESIATLLGRANRNVDAPVVTIENSNETHRFDAEDTITRAYFANWVGVVGCRNNIFTHHNYSGPEWVSRRDLIFCVDDGSSQESKENIKSLVTSGDIQKHLDNVILENIQKLIDLTPRDRLRNSTPFNYSRKVASMDWMRKTCFDQDDLDLLMPQQLFTRRTRRTRRQKEEAKDCRICLMEFEENQPLRRMPVCRNLLHKACVDRWFQNSTCCPFCRRDLIHARPSTR